MQIKELLNYLELSVPLKYQEHYDNSGMICGDENTELSGVLICIDSVEGHIDEALKKNCNLIIAHHPLIFGEVKKITTGDYIGRTLMKAIRNNIAIYAMHTNLDNMLHNGVSEKIALKLGLLEISLLSSKTGSNSDELPIGSGVTGQLPIPMDEKEFLHFLKNTLNTNCIRHTRLLGKAIQKVAICGGSGVFLLKNAIQANADVYVSADFKYHDFFDADGKILVADTGHYESEQFTVEIIYDIITKRFSNFAAHLTELNSNPINYL
ncbi:MAG TPA: Nif3-like dinuclear metal center hexameric protein [Saprospiraceae bacterium]|nr:Nif3-like dinuclear metal center hexameric protein [Saprospirales bacterium]HRQ30894.1 Nif3-like dinuclear metal center hexameric protein [Saprospiraceae bacterium]